MTDSLPLFTIAPDQPFLQRLAQTLFDDRARHEFFGDGALQDVHILLPTRRAARHLAYEFLTLAAQAGSGTVLLPRIDTLGDLDEDAPQSGATPLSVPPAIEPMARHFHLLALVRAWAKASGHLEGGQLTPVKLSALAFELEAFLDQAQNEQLDLARLPDLVPDELAENWQQTLDFLTIITEYWPQHLRETGCLDPTERRNALLAERRDSWQATPPAHPVIAAGSTGSIRATADLLKVIAHLPRGAVVLPGLDCQADDDLWQQIEQDVSHPQYGLAQTLTHIGATRQHVRPWPGSEASDPDQPCRTDIINQALVPASATANWVHANRSGNGFADDGLTGLHLIEAPDMRSEAGVIALVMREVLQSDGRTAALVTRDRKLARRVASELQRWGVHVDDSAGKPLANGPTAIWLRHILACLADDFAPLPLLALLKHPKTCLAEDRAAHRRMVQLLEKRLLRGVRPPPHKAGGLAALQAALATPDLRQNTDDDPDIAAFLSRLEAAFQPLLTADETALMDAHCAALLGVAQALLPVADSVLVDDEEGRALAKLFEKLSDQAALAGPVSKADWPALLDMWMMRQSLRAQGPTHKRLHIWGPLEARLMQADVMILGGLNETVWPPMPETGPWLSRPMRAALGMSQPERQIGLAAHDFVQAAAADKVYLTRAAKIDNAPSVAARWLRRLETLAGQQARHEQARLLHWWQQLDQAATHQPAEAPAPCPPVAARPKRLSVTQIETLLHNPYEIYARKILNLTPWEAVDAPPHAGHRGTLVHAVLEDLVSSGAHRHDDVPAAILRTADKLQQTRPGGTAILAYWQARLAAIGEWLSDFEAARPDWQASAVEALGRLELEIDGAPFTVTAIADRLDRMADGRVDIIDYKTGAVPSKKAVETHLAPQLTLEAAMLEAAGFDDMTADSAAARRLVYVHVTGRQPAAELTEITCTPELIDGARHMVEQLIAGYRQPQQPYLVHIRSRTQAARHTPFDHLARLKEWRSMAEVEHG